MSYTKLRTLNSVMNEVYNRISQNKPFDKTLKPYKKSHIDEVLEYFEDREDYEKCQILLKKKQESIDIMKINIDEYEHT